MVKEIAFPKILGTYISVLCENADELLGKAEESRGLWIGLSARYLMNQYIWLDNREPVGAFTTLLKQRSRGCQRIFQSDFQNNETPENPAA